LPKFLVASALYDYIMVKLIYVLKHIRNYNSSSPTSMLYGFVNNNNKCYYHLRL